MSGHNPVSLEELKKASQKRQIDFVKLDESGHEIQFHKFLSLEGEIWDDYLFERDLNVNLMQTARLLVALGVMSGDKHMFFNVDELPTLPADRLQFVLNASLEVPKLLSTDDTKQLCNAIADFNRIGFRLTVRNANGEDSEKKSD